MDAARNLKDYLKPDPIQTRPTCTDTANPPSDLPVLTLAAESIDPPEPLSNIHVAEPKFKDEMWAPRTAGYR